MRFPRKSDLAVLLLCTVPGTAWADGIGPFVNSVASANKAEGSPADVFSSDFSATVVATGSDALENPSGPITTFGDLVDDASTNPDQNLFLVIDGQTKGPTKGYDYGHHFLIQGHEISHDFAYVTRLNLDVTDPAHHVTLLTPVGGDGLTHFDSFDGSAYDPFTKSLLFTQEKTNSKGGVIEVSMGWPPKATSRGGSIGVCSYEGIHTDNAGRVYIVEDASGKSVSNDENNIDGPEKVAKQPGGYIYRFVPTDKSDLGAGRLEALQVWVDGAPLTFGGVNERNAFKDVWSPKQVELHSGASFPTKWITIHDTAKDGTAPFDCNHAARDAGATPFKRPENGMFRPDGTFRTFVFATTGDTNNESGSVPGLAERGAWGALFQLTLDAKQQDGSVQVIALGDSTHNSFDNVTWGDSNTILTTEDRGDTLHDQLDTLDSVWAYPLNAMTSPLRVVALGRDKSASGDGQEDNEPTGVFVSNGESTRADQYGTTGNMVDARGFVTKQHGDNTVYELHHN